MRAPRDDCFLQMLEAARGDEPQYLGVAEHRGRMREHFRLLPNLGAKSRTIGLMVERPHGVRQRQAFDFRFEPGLRLAQHLDRRKRRRLRAGLEWTGASRGSRAARREAGWRRIWGGSGVEVWAQTGAQHGLAFAFPLLDRRVVEFSLSLPGALFPRDGFRRRPFRDAMADVLPAPVRLRHQKYQPFPGHMLDLVESKDELLALIDAYGQTESVCSMIDLVQLRRLVEAVPSPERVREEMRQGGQPTAAASLIMAAHVLEAAAYLEQHGGPAQYLSRRARR